MAVLKGRLHNPAGLCRRAEGAGTALDPCQQRTLSPPTPPQAFAGGREGLLERVFPNLKTVSAVMTGEARFLTHVRTKQRIGAAPRCM